MHKYFFFAAVVWLPSLQAQPQKAKAPPPPLPALAQANWIDMDGVRMVEPPHEHPRLYLMTRDLPDLCRRMTHPVTKPAWEELQAMAKASRQIRLEVDAMRYLLDRNADLGRRTVADALRLLQSSEAGLKEENASRKIGRMMVTAAIVYDWCYPVLAADQKAAFIASLIRMAKSLECGYPPDKLVAGGFVNGHPAEWMILRDMLSAGVAIYDENPEMYRLAAHRFFGTHLPARNWWYPGGAFHQGPGYANARWVSDMYALWIFARMGAGNVFNPSQQFVPYEWTFLRRPDGKFLRSGDGQNWPTQLGSLLTASYYGDGYILANFLKDPVEDPKQKLFDFLWPDPDRKTMPATDDKLWEFLWRDPDLKPLPLSDLPLSRYFGFPYGWMVARTGWGDESVIAQMKTNIYNFSGHQHADAGDFAIYYKGPLVAHSGIYQGTMGGFTGAHQKNYYRRTVAHSTLLIHDPNEKLGDNDGGQRSFPQPITLDDLLRGDTYKTGTVLGQGFGPDPRKPDYTYLKSDITAAYSAKVKEVKRSFVFLNLAGSAVPAALIVFDRVVSSNPEFAKYWLLQSVKAPSVVGNTSTLNLSGGESGWSGKLVNTALLPELENARITTVGGPGKEFFSLSKNYLEAKIPPDPEMGGWRIQISPKHPAATDVFFCVMQIMDGDTPPLAVERVGTGETVGMRISDRIVIFNAKGDRTSGPVSFAAPGAATCRFLVTDLAEGTWQLWRDGRIERPAVMVSSDAGTAYFEGPGGNYTLRR